MRILENALRFVAAVFLVLVVGLVSVDWPFAEELGEFIFVRMFLWFPLAILILLGLGSREFPDSLQVSSRKRVRGAGITLLVISTLVLVIDEATSFVILVAGPRNGFRGVEDLLLAAAIVVALVGAFVRRVGIQPEEPSRPSP